MKISATSGNAGVLTTGSASPCNCVLRYPGRVLVPGELIPAEVVEFIGAQLGLSADDLVDYGSFHPRLESQTSFSLTVAISDDF